MNIRGFIETYESERQYKIQISTKISNLVRSFVYSTFSQKKLIELNKIKLVIIDSIKTSRYDLCIKVHMFFYFYKIEEGLNQICYNRAIGTKILLDDFLTCIIISSMWPDHFPEEITNNFLEKLKKSTV